MNTYKLTPHELASFSDDISRGSLRSRLAAEYPNGVYIEDASGNLLDKLDGDGSTVDSDSTELAVVLTDEEVEERKAKAELLKLEADHMEFDVRPLVMTRLRDEAKAEVADRMREKSNQILLLESQLKRANGMLALGPAKTREELESLKVTLVTHQTRLTDVLNELASEAEKTEELSKQLAESHDTIEKLKGDLESAETLLKNVSEKSGENTAVDLPARDDDTLGGG